VKYRIIPGKNPASLARADAKYAIADRFDEAKGEYAGLRLGRLVEIDFNSDMVLVRREVAAMA
jgi:hypothetical protein